MGKLGGWELNYASDVDLLFVYAADGHTSGGSSGVTSAHEFCDELGLALSRKLTKAGQPARSLRVDLDLRPEGRSGPIANSLDALEYYYSTFGRPWERQAWIKARPIAGHLSVGIAAQRRLESFVFPRRFELSSLAQVSSMVSAIDHQSQLEGQAEHDVKLGRGGIRSVEFLVQGLQLLHGGKQPRLRSPNTLQAIEALQVEGHLTEQEARVLGEAYVFFRRVEHVLQLRELRQTHLLPSSTQELLVIARLVGVNKPHTSEEAKISTTPSPSHAKGLSTDEGLIDAFQIRAKRHRDLVESVKERIFGRDESAIPRNPASERVQQALYASLPEAALARLCEEYGFSEPHCAASHLQTMGRRPFGPFGHAAAPALRQVGMELLDALWSCPERDSALAYLTRFLVSLPLSVAPQLLQSLAGDPQLVAMLLNVFGSSHFLSRALLSEPELLLYRLKEAIHPVERSVVTTSVSVDPLSSSALQGLSECSEEEGLNLLRRFKNESMLRIALRDLGEHHDLEKTSLELSALAEQCLDGALELATRFCTERFGWPLSPNGEPVAFGVVALGRLGCREMSYGSDLDLIVLHGGEGQSAGGSRKGLPSQEFFTRLTTKLISGLTLPLASGRLYAIDGRLRPSGNQGALVTSHSAFVRYHHQQSQTWEQQALCKARVVSTRFDPTHSISKALHQCTYRPRAAPDIQKMALEILEMRKKQGIELARSSQERCDPKLGEGGLATVESIAQYFQLGFGYEHPELQTQSVGEVLREANNLQLLDTPTYLALDSNWRFLRRLENRLRIVHDRAIHEFPTYGPLLDALARRLGYHENELQKAQGVGLTLLGDFHQATSGIQVAFEHILRDRAP